MPTHTPQPVVLDTSRSPESRLKPVPLTAVRIDDEFWAPRIRTTRAVTLPSQYEQCEASGRIDNFRRAAGRKQIEFQGRFYNDSDVYKWLEAASYALATEPDAALARRVDALVEDIAAAQGPDGYLNTYFTFERAGERFTNLVRMHELYCAGHFIQAAVAHRRATGKTTALAVATRLADYICGVFGPEARRGTDGHEEIELALVELYRETGNRTYLERARFFLDQRGQRPPVLDGSTYLQDHLPVREQRDVVGHAVRATYLACGMVDVFLETGEEALWDAASRLWESAFERKAYVTGGLGSRHEGEAFGDDYELPNDRAYAESCAAIGSVFWNWRMLQRHGDARYADQLERSLYNGVLAGISLRGDRYFYVNPLADRGGHRRQAWFDCACCPPNLSRLLMSLPAYCYSASAEGAWVHLYASGGVAMALPGGERIALGIETRYPWEGSVRVTIEEAPVAAASLFLRIPGWCAEAEARVRGEPYRGRLRPGSYLEVRSRWKAGEAVELTLAMPVTMLASHPRVLASSGRAALARGPLVYCVEAADNPGFDVWDLAVRPGSDVRAELAPGLLGGVVALRGQGRVDRRGARAAALYAPATDAIEGDEVRFTAIPYYAWAERSPGAMAVWLRCGR